MENLRNELEKLRDRELQLSFIKNLNFNSEEEALVFQNEHRLLFEELRTILSRIREIEWQLKSDVEKKEERDQRIQLVLKFSEENNNKGKVEYMQLYVQLINLVQRLGNHDLISMEGKSLFQRIEEELQKKDFIGLK